MNARGLLRHTSSHNPHIRKQILPSLLSFNSSMSQKFPSGQASSFYFFSELFPNLDNVMNFVLM